jgi:alpha-beta hydrolase superfamily lysophospholipase
LLHPYRRTEVRDPALPHESVDLAGDGVTLKGWIFRTATARRRGTVIYLHGLADNRGSSAGLARRLGPRGFDVVAYDSRAHGQSGGDACTYGYYEKRDLARVLDRLGDGAGPFVLFGNSMGAAVALQEAADDRRIAAIVAVAPISDLRTAVFERAPFIASRRNVEDALRIAESRGSFEVAAVSPVAAATRVRCPVLLIHGARDRETPPAHSQRVFAALASPKKLVLPATAAHNDALTAEAWKEIDAWLDAWLPPGS